MSQNAASKKFFSRLYYSSCSEDLDSELVGLAIKPDDVIFAIGGGGGRAIGLLGASPRKVIAIDSNVHQCQMIELKKAAIKGLTWEEFISFLGVFKKPKNMAELYKKVELHLPLGARDYWSKQIESFSGSLIFSGEAEKNFRSAARILNFFFKSKLDALFNAKTIERQLEVWRTLSNGWLWKLLFKLGCDPRLHRKQGNFGWPTADDSGAENFILDRVNMYVQRNLARDSHFLQMIFMGRYLFPESLPHYLREDRFAHIKRNIDHLEIVCDDLLGYLIKQPPRSIDKFSVSNIWAYLNAEQTANLKQELLRVAKKEGRILSRTFLTYAGPWNTDEKVQEQTNLNKSLIEVDKSFVYGFSVVDF